MIGTYSTPNVQIERPSEDVLRVRATGDWRQSSDARAVDIVGQALNKSPAIRSVEFDTTELIGWDTRFVAFISECAMFSRKRHVDVRDLGLPEGVRRLLRLADAVPVIETYRGAATPHLLTRIGQQTLNGYSSTVTLFTFLGQNIAATGKLLRGRAQFRWGDAFLVMHQTGPAALGIVAMINFLIGLIVAFVGELELQHFGASIYVADLVGIASVRELSPIMTGVILCGRTGAAFAAQLGTMKVNEEINALQTFGISPVEFLVLPRMIALMLMMPFLCVFADLISIFGGYCVSMTVLDITSTVYIHRTIDAIRLSTFLLGIIKGSFFGFLVAYTGCLRGMQSGYSAAAVGQATTQAVVLGISSIIAFDGVFALICNALKI
jgi:phospholipid/cholesterol/gamma-HCH transport system permease protein